MNPLRSTIDHAALGDLALETVEELLPLRPLGREVELLDDLRLRGLQELEELGPVDRVRPVVVFGTALDVWPDPIAPAHIADPAGRLVTPNRAG